MNDDQLVDVELSSSSDDGELETEPSAQPSYESVENPLIGLEEPPIAIEHEGEQSQTDSSISENDDSDAADRLPVPSRPRRNRGPPQRYGYDDNFW